MTDDWPTSFLSTEPEKDDPPIPLDRYGIPILNEIVDPEALQPEAIENHLQQDLLFPEDEATNLTDSELPDKEMIRKELITEIRQEMQVLIEQTSTSIADRMREEIAATLRESLTEAVDKRLQALLEVPADTDTSHTPE